ncbi:hypothetical protein DFQ28_010262 [Apophysomyces sp. BC1034]|nr:hypothetical protein DFQ30_008514 [Apophysomyces sp. BC1015]KAG0184909.1 hypothetical protein DFQ28_010262 [Apophysomyces sp. BC1034]
MKAPRKDRKISEQEHPRVENENDRLASIFQRLQKHKEEENEELNMVYDVDPMFGPGPLGSFRWFKGRRFHNHIKKGAFYPLPNDKTELDRMKVLFYLMRWAFEGEILVPVKHKLQEGITVLNVGCGPGMWTGHPILDMALDYCHSQFVAVDICDLLTSEQTPPADISSPVDNVITNPVTKSTDLSSIPPSLSLAANNTSDSTHKTMVSSSLPHTNISFSDSYFPDIQSSPSFYPPIDFSPHTATSSSARKIFDNLDVHVLNVKEQPLPFPDNSFDLIIQRLVTASYTLSDWKRVLKELMRVLKPGGYIQLVEIDYLSHQLGPKGCEATRQKLHTEPRIGLHLVDLLKAVGLENVDSRLVSLPLGPWGLELGGLWQQNMETFAEATMPLLVSILGISMAECKKHWEDFRDELEDRKAFSNIHAAWGCKPEGPVTIDWEQCSLFKKEPGP